MACTVLLLPLPALHCAELTMPNVAVVHVGSRLTDAGQDLLQKASGWNGDGFNGTSWCHACFGIFEED